MAMRNIHKSSTVNPIRLEVYKHLFASIAEEMGVILRKASFSPNIKERRDFSCAVFDTQGRMVAQAAHIHFDAVGSGYGDCYPQRKEK